MSERGLERLEQIMERGFDTLADLQRETNARLDQTNARLETLEGKVETLTERVGVIETVLTDLASQLVAQGRVLRSIADRHDTAIEELRRRLDAVEKRLGEH